MALARVREARALRALAGSGRLPRVCVSGSASRQGLSENGPIDLGALSDLGFAELENDVYQAGFDASWEIDVFGGVRRRTERAQARLEATVEGARDVLVSVAAEVARTYVELRGAQRRLELAERNVRIQASTLQLARDRFETGTERVAEAAAEP